MIILDKKGGEKQALVLKVCSISNNFSSLLDD